MRSIHALSLRAAIAVLALIGLVAPAGAQTTLNSTTFSAAVNATVQIVPVTATTNISAGDYIAVSDDGRRVSELMTVQSVNTGTLTVSRGQGGTGARAHKALALVYTGAPGRFYRNTVSGSCTASAERFLPHIVYPEGTISQCSPAGVWYRLDDQFNVVCRSGQLATGSIDQTCWQADGNYVLVAVREVHTVKEASGTLTLIARRQQSTEAAASGDALITALDMASAATVETVRTATLTTTVADLLIFSGNRLGLDFTDDVAGELAGVVVTFTLAPW